MPWTLTTSQYLSWVSSSTKIKRTMMTKRRDLFTIEISPMSNGIYKYIHSAISIDLWMLRIRMSISDSFVNQSSRNLLCNKVSFPMPPRFSLCTRARHWITEVSKSLTTNQPQICASLKKSTYEEFNKFYFC